MTAPAVARTAWQQQGVWSRTASDLKQSLSRSRAWVLGLTIAAAVSEVAAAPLLAKSGAMLTAGRVLAAGGAALIAVAALIRSRGLSRERMSEWIRARSASEGLKAAVYLYETRAGDYSAADPSRVLQATLDRILNQVADLEPYAARVRPPEREPPDVHEVAAYVKERVEKQIEGYYRPKAAEFAKRLAVFRHIELALLLGGAILGAFASVFAVSALAPWIAVLTTVSAAMATHVAAARYEHQIITYRGTARRLESLRDEWEGRASGTVATAEEASAFIQNAEDAISTENEAWMAEWVKTT